MGWLSDWLNDLESDNAPAPVAPITAVKRPRPEIKHTWFQIRPPKNGDLGMVEAAHYFVVDGVLTICDETGKPSGRKYFLAPDDDARLIAARLAKEVYLKASKYSDFNRPLHYQPLGIA